MNIRAVKNHLPLLLLFLFLGVSLGWMENAYLSPPDSASYYAVARSLVLDGDVRFLNEYQAFRFEPNMLYLTPNDLFSNDWPIGSGLFWAPFVAMAHGTAKLLGAVGIENPYVQADGYSGLYRLFAVSGILLMAVVGLVIGWFAVARRHGDWAALAGVLLLLLGTPFGFYFYYYVFMAHITSFFLVTVFLAMWMHRAGEERGLLEWAVLGIVGGWMTMVRPQNAVVMVVVLVEAGYMIGDAFGGGKGLTAWKAGLQKRSILDYGKGIVILGAFALLAFLPQMIFWWKLYGNAVQMPKIEEMHWFAPRIDLMLFSTYHGLLSWSPVLLLAIPGLWILHKENRIVGSAFALVLLLQVYINGANEIWWAGGSFGNRRFVDYSFIFLMVFGACWGRWRRSPVFAVLAVGAALWNFGLIAAERAHVLTLDRHVNWTGEFLVAVGKLMLRPGDMFLAMRGDFAGASVLGRIGAVVAILGVSGAAYRLLRNLMSDSATKSKSASALYAAAMVLMVGFGVWMTIGVCRTEKIDLNSAETKEFERALANREYGEVISRRNRLLWNNYYEAGFYYLTEGDLQASARHYEKAKDLLPSHPSAYRYLGVIHLQNGDLGEARTNLEKALEIRSNYGSAAQTLAQVYDQILRKEPRNREVVEQLARLLLRSEQYESALRVADYLLQLDPENKESRKLYEEIEKADDGK